MLDFDEDPVPDGWNRWGLGVAGPVLATSAAAWTSTQTSLRVGVRRGKLHLQGSDVTAVAMILVAAAVFLHAYYFWTGTERFHFVRQLAQVGALLLGLIAFGVIVVHQLQLF